MRISKNVKVAAAGLAMVCSIAAAPAVAAAGSTEGRAGAGQGVTAGATSAAGQLTERVSGTWKDASGKMGKVQGTLTPTSFAKVGDQLMMTADVVLRATGQGAPKGAVTKTITRQVKGAAASDRGDGAVTSASTLAAPVPAGCDILSLDLGPLTLDVLGLVVVLQPVVLDIVAVPGAGNLLGNLLCAVAGLLDNPSRLARLLNDILAIVG